MSLLRLLVLISISIFLLIAGGCETNSVDTDTDPSELPENVSFSQDIQPIFSQSCGGGACHISRTTSGVRLDSYSSVLNSRGNQYEKPIVVPEEPDQSPLVDKIQANPDIGIRMPQGREPLSGEQIDLIKGWIAEGAPDN